MWKSFYEGHALIDLPLIAMAFFAIAFAVVLVRAFTRARADDPRAALPLDDDSTPRSMT